MRSWSSTIDHFVETGPSRIITYAIREGTPSIKKNARLLQQLLHLLQRPPTARLAAATAPRRRGPRQAPRAVGVPCHRAPRSERPVSCAEGYLAGGDSHSADGAAVVGSTKDDDVLLSGRVPGDLERPLDCLRAAAMRTAYC